MSVRAGFALVALALAALLVAGVFFAWRRTGATPRRTRVATAITVLGLLVWLGITHVAAARGVLQFQPPPTMLLLLAVMLGLSIALGVSGIGRRLAAGLPLAVLVGAQGFRLPLELLMHRAHVNGIMPVQMSYSGLNFDIITGALAIVISLLLWRGHAGRGVVRAWNVLGALLLANVVVIALLSAPTPFRRFSGPPNVFVTEPGYVWLPTVMVAFAILGHIVVCRRLRIDSHAVR